MKTRLPRALAALGVALLLSSIEAEGKMLLLLLWQVTLKNSRKEKTYLLCFCCLLCFLCTSPVTSLLQRNVLFLRCVYSQAFRSSSSSSPVLYSAVWSLCACLQCAVHTVAFPEDQSPGEGNSCIQFYQEDPGGLGTRNLRTWTSSQDQQLITWVGTVTLVTT